MNTDFETINLSELSDVDIVARMRHCNFEKYKTLVRMHLSFALDLNTDEFDLPCHEIAYEDKGKIKKWNKLSKKHKGTSAICASTAKSAGNSPSEGLQQQIDAGFMFHLTELKEFLMLEKNLKQEGIFRKTGSVSRQNELRLKIQSETPLELEASGFSAHDCATVFKSFLAELTEPLLTDAHYPAHLQIAPLCIGRSFNSSVSTLTRPPNPERIKREQRLLHSMQLLILLLPEENRKLLEHIIDILHAVANMEHINKMSADNLATIFAPHLICPRNLPPEALHYLAKKLCSIIAYMVTKGYEIFHIPAKLSTDIRAYFIERKRKKTMSPEQTLDDSISDISTVNTVYTFVDRERTAKCNTKNTTDTELAQLYAHIQSLPESSKKRRLIKQFNKQNGQGTPLQLVIMNRLKNSEATRSAKSFGDSIKKHIFHKSIMSRTPKRTSTATPVGVETPNSSNAKQPKLRVLFQSPPTACLCTSSAGATPEKLPSRKISKPSVTNDPYALNVDSLQKSVSSTSLLLNSSQRNTHVYSNHNSNTNQYISDEIDILSSCSSSTNSNDGLSQPQLNKVGYSASAPVSRQTSHDLYAVEIPLPKSMCTLNASNSSLLSSSSSSSASSQNFQNIQPNCCVTPLKLISEVAKQLVASTASGAGGVLEKKSVAWDDCSPIEGDNHLEPSTSLLPIGSVKELKSRYKSEPNLSRIFKDKVLDILETVPEPQEEEHSTLCNVTANTTGISMTRKLIKGVSMGNLKFPFSTPESTKRLVRTVSSSLKRRHSNDSSTTINDATEEDSTQLVKTPLLGHDPNSFDDLDDDTFEDDPNDHLDSDSDIDDVDNETLESAVNTQTGINRNSSDIPDIAGGICNLVQPSGLYRNIDLITSTPSLLLGRRSMSPITKSAQRMPRSMQESIMTPRSRKPVMVLTTTLGSSDPNHTIYQTDLSSFREQDEDSSLSPDTNNYKNDDAISVAHTDLMNKRAKAVSGPNIDHDNESSDNNVSGAQNNMENCKSSVLSENFKEYLRSRSVLTDSSFSSHPDDFGDDNDTDIDNESTHEIVDLNESQLSPSLLYCLDGNEPTEPDMIENVESNSKDTEDSNGTFFTPPTPTTSHGHGLVNRYDGDCPFSLLNNARKRAATNDISGMAISTIPTKTKQTEANERDCMSAESGNSNKENISSKKILIGDFPNETSF